MRERRIGMQELEANLRGCLEEVRRGTTLLLTDGGHRVARVNPGTGSDRVEGWPGNRVERTAAEEDQAQGAPAGRWEHGRHRQGEPQVTLLYVDTSALFKRYVEEHDSAAVLARIDEGACGRDSGDHAGRGSGRPGEGRAGAALGPQRGRGRRAGGSWATGMTSRESV